MSLFWKIFVSFMIAMTVTSAGAIYVTYRIVSRPLTQTDFEGRDRIIGDVSEPRQPLQREGAAGKGHQKQQ